MKIKNNYMATASIITCLAIVAIIVVNILFGAVGTKVNLKIDMTKDKVLSFSDATYEALDKLDTTVNVYSLIPEDDSNDIINKLREIIEKYAKLSSNINYSVVDAEKNPEFVQKYTAAGENFSIYSVIFETDKRYKVVDLNNAVTWSSTTQTVESISAEKMFTTALLHVTSDKTIKVGVVEGHGELATAAYFDGLLADEGYAVEAVNLLTSDIADDINMLIVSTPEKDFDAAEIDKIDAFLDKGNSMQFLMAPTGVVLPNLDGYLKEWGIEFKPGYIAETDRNHYYQSQLYVLPEMVECDVTQGLADSGLMILYPGCRGIKENTNPYVTEQVLLTTTDNAITKANISDTITDGEITVEEGDVKEKSNLASIVEKQIDDDKTARIFVTGAINFIQQSIISSNFANNDFYMNTIAAITDNEANIYIRAKDVSADLLTITDLWILIYGALTIIVIPLILFITGLVVWLRRRHL